MAHIFNSNTQEKGCDFYSNTVSQKEKNKYSLINDILKRTMIYLFTDVR